MKHCMFCKRIGFFTMCFGYAKNEDGSPIIEVDTVADLSAATIDKRSGGVTKRSNLAAVSLLAIPVETALPDGVWVCHQCAKILTLQDISGAIWDLLEQASKIGGGEDD